MGVWGSGLYANDTSCDVRDTYLDFLQDGFSDSDAYEKTLAELGECLEDEDEAPLFWYALAETQWKVGRLTPDVRAKALEWIDHSGGLNLWQESATKGAGWLKTLAKLKEKLESPMPKRKAIRKPQVVDENFWELNDLYAYQFPFDDPRCAHLAGKYIVFQKMGEGVKHSPGTKMRVHIYNRLFDSLPVTEDLDGVRLLPLDLYDRLNNPGGRSAGLNLCMSTMLLRRRLKEYPESQFTFIGNRPGPINIPARRDRYAALSWEFILKWLPRYYDEWHDVEYEDLGNGTFQYIDP